VTELNAEIGRLAAGLASGILSPAVMGEISKREREIAKISDRLLSSRPDSMRLRVKALCEQAMQRIRDLREYLNTNTPKARAYLVRHFEKIVMELTGRAYVASGLLG